MWGLKSWIYWLILQVKKTVEDQYAVLKVKTKCYLCYWYKKLKIWKSLDFFYYGICQEKVIDKYRYTERIKNSNKSKHMYWRIIVWANRALSLICISTWFMADEKRLIYLAVARSGQILLHNGPAEASSLSVKFTRFRLS